MNRLLLSKGGLFILFLCTCSCNNIHPHKNNQQFTIYEGEVKEADSLYRLKSYLPSLARYKDLILVTGGDSLDYFRSAYCEAMLFDFKGAIDDYKHALALNYKNKASCYLNLTASYSYIRNYDMTKYYGNKCLEIDNSKTQTINRLIFLSQKQDVTK
jgi:tetratricopeptide (TPR) repeat protein